MPSHYNVKRAYLLYYYNTFFYYTCQDCIDLSIERKLILTKKGTAISPSRVYFVQFFFLILFHQSNLYSATNYRFVFVSFLPTETIVRFNRHVVPYRLQKPQTPNRWERTGKYGTNQNNPPNRIPILRKPQAGSPKARRKTINYPQKRKPRSEGISCLSL